ncbi:MAG: hypothetical protein ACYCOU_21920 [Sulfobacillus sp.]
MIFIDGKTQARLDSLINEFTCSEQADLRIKGIQSEHYAWLVEANSGDPFWAEAVLQQLQSQE